MEELEAGRRELNEVTQQCSALREANRELQLTRERVELELRGQVSQHHYINYNYTLLTEEWFSVGVQTW